ncbi:hypothetical protein B0O99DRAFT_711775 [Bisporella sp. PMI_857]|nr:hypothetical protein B0O99DRAFT_711775 [Bisporella sp. PMI_857]
MDKAKAAVSNFLNRDGKHDTTVHETVGPAITNEKIHRTQHDEAQTVIDREVHQDHYHTSIQPIHHKEVLPEEHTHNLVGVEHRKINHGNDEHVRKRLEAEKSQFKDTREVSEIHHTKSAAATVVGEHVHHHVHEHIQPVIQKETIQPSVVHTTIPIHEIHHNEAKHHSITQLPPVTLDEFKKQGGHLAGRAERTDAFKGEPKSVGGTLGGSGARGTTSLTENDWHNGTHGAHNATTGTAAGLNGPHGNGLTHNKSNGSTNSQGTKKRASLLDKLNPLVDSNGDGKAGFLK